MTFLEVIPSHPMWYRVVSVAGGRLMMAGLNQTLLLTAFHYTQLMMTMIRIILL